MIHYVLPGETLTQIARDFRMSYQHLLATNPAIVNPDLLYVGQPIQIPGYPDPATLPYRIEISLKKRTLQLYKDGVLQKTYPIAVGRILHGTPVGSYIVLNKAPNPGGPFGTMWMSLSKEHYGIHGTNDPSSIGKAVSRGCIRMQNRDVEELASIIPLGTAVDIHM